MSININRRLRNVLNTLLILAFSSILFFLGFKTSDSGYYDEVIRPKLKKAVLPVMNVFRAKPADALEVRIEIGDKEFDRIKKIRERALLDGVFLEGKDEWSSAQMIWNDSSIDVDLRLKGGLLDHLKNDRWSFRIRTDSAGFRGMQRFSIQHPNTRNFVHEKILHLLAKDQDILSLRYEFMKVEINEDLGGIYAVEEHFDEALLIRQGRPPGPILKFNDEARIAWLALEKRMQVDTVVQVPNFYLTAAIDVYNEQHYLQNDTLKAQLDRALDLLSGFRSGRYNTSRTFDLAKMAKLFVLADLLGAQHCTDWRNIRFYYNEAIDRLEPIVYDGNAGERISAVRALREQGPLLFDTTCVVNFYERLFSDRTFYAAYIAGAEQMSKAGQLEDMLAPYQEGIRKDVNLINTEFPNFEYDEGIYKDCRETIRYTIDPPVALLAYIDTVFPGELRISLGSTQGLPIEVLRVTEGKDEWVAPEAYLIPPLVAGCPTTTKPYLFYALGHLSVDVKDMEVQYRILGTEKVRTEKVRPYSAGESADRK